jgi:DNA adenine methylase
LSSIDYAEVLATLPKGAFAYLDPPYDPVSDTSSFTGYSKGGFTRDDQIRLRECCDALNARGVKFLLSNSATNFIREQYAAYHISVVQAKRAINSDATKRGGVDELLVRNYE